MSLRLTLPVFKKGQLVRLKEVNLPALHTEEWVSAEGMLGVYLMNERPIGDDGILEETPMHQIYIPKLGVKYFLYENEFEHVV